MKKFLFSALLFAGFYTNATIRTVSNSPSTTLAQFNTIQAAINASSSGDTVYVHGSPIGYGNFTITNKRLVIIGPGWSPDKTLPFTASVGHITLTGNCSNSEIQGLVIRDFATFSATSSTVNLRFIRNQVTSEINITQESVTYSGYLFEGNHFSSSGRIFANPFSIYQNFVFQNNVFFNSGFQIGRFGNALSTVLFNHNLWFGSGDVFLDCQSLLISNNIFVGRNAATGNSLSQFSNNITFNAGNNTPWASNSNTDNGGNVANQDPQMVAQTSVNAGTNNPLLDFTIAAGPANNTGGDGKDMGLLYDATGSLNWTNSRNSRIPRIFSFVIANPVIQPNGTLNITVEARKSN